MPLMNSQKLSFTLAPLRKIHTNTLATMLKNTSTFSRHRTTMTTVATSIGFAIMSIIE